jgi:hypothetical protein
MQFFFSIRHGTSPQITTKPWDILHVSGVSARKLQKAHAFPMNYISAPTGLSRTFRCNFMNTYYFKGARGGAVGWGTALQAGRPRVRFQMGSLVFFIDVNVLAALWPWGRLSL